MDNEVERRVMALWTALPKWRRCQLRIKQVAPSQRHWIRALYAAACAGDQRAQAALGKLFERTARGVLKPRKELTGFSRQRKAIPVALNWYLKGK